MSYRCSTGNVPYVNNVATLIFNQCSDPLAVIQARLTVTIQFNDPNYIISIGPPQFPPITYTLRLISGTMPPIYELIIPKESVNRASISNSGGSGLITTVILNDFASIRLPKSFIEDDEYIINPIASGQNSNPLFASGRFLRSKQAGFRIDI